MSISCEKSLSILLIDASLVESMAIREVLEAENFSLRIAANCR